MMERHAHEQRLDPYLAQYYPSFETGGQIWTRLVGTALRPGQRILAAGAGENDLLCKILSGNGVERIGLPRRPLPANHPADQRIQANLESIPARDQSFDLVTSEFAREHLADPLAAFRAIRRVFKPGGQFIFLIGNGFNLIMVFSKLTPRGGHALLRERLLAQAAAEIFPTTCRANSQRNVRTGPRRRLRCPGNPLGGQSRLFHLLAAAARRHRRRATDRPATA